MRRHRFPILVILIVLTTFFSTSFRTFSGIKTVIPVEKKVAVIFIKFSPDCPSDDACNPEFPPELRANINTPRDSASYTASLLNLNMTRYIMEATYSHTHMVFSAIVNPNSSDGWFEIPYGMRYYSQPETNLNFRNIFEDALQLAYSAVGDDIQNYDVILLINNIQSQYGYTLGCSYTAPGDYVTCPITVPSSSGGSIKQLSLVHIGEHADNESMFEVLGHELGHVHNLFHVWMGPYDIVGNSDVLTHYGGWSKSRAGWVPQVTDLDAPGEVTVSLDPLEHPGHNVLRIPFVKYGDVFSGFIVECRAKIGFDVNIPEEGVIVSYASTNGMNGDIGLQAVIGFPEYDGDFTDAALSPGEAYVNIAHNVTITYISRDTAGRCTVKAQRGQIHAPDPMINPWSETDSGVGYVKYSSRDIWIDSQSNGWDVYAYGSGMTSEGGEIHPTGYGDTFWPNHDNKIKYVIHNTGYDDARDVWVDIYVTQPMILFNRCSDETSLNYATLLGSQNIELLRKDESYFGEILWTPMSSSTAQVDVVIRDYMGEVTHENNIASETYTASQHLTYNLTAENLSSGVLESFGFISAVNIIADLECSKDLKFKFDRKLISGIDR